MGRIRYQFDEHLPTVVAVALRSRGIDTVTAAEIGVRKVADRQVLAIAHEASRVIVTRDKDFLRLDADGVPHSGIVYVGQKTGAIGELIEMLELVCEAISAEEMIGHIEH